VFPSYRLSRTKCPCIMERSTAHLAHSKILVSASSKYSSFSRSSSIRFQKRKLHDTLHWVKFYHAFKPLAEEGARFVLTFFLWPNFEPVIWLPRVYYHHDDQEYADLKTLQASAYLENMSGIGLPRALRKPHSEG
jgi:hypothetical protein